MAALDIKAGFDRWVASQEKTWAHDRSKSLGASEAFGCLRKAAFKKRGYPEDSDEPQSWGALRRGDLIENEFVGPEMQCMIQEMTEDMRMHQQGEKQRTFIDKNLSATPDGLVIYCDDDALAHYGIPSLGTGGDPEAPEACFVFEIKSIDPRVNLKEEKQIHHGQAQIQMGLIRRQTSWKPQFAVVIYIDASFFDDIDIFVVEYDEKAFQAAVSRADTVFDDNIDVSEILAEGKITGECKYCPFTKACAEATHGSMPQEGTALGDGDLPEDRVEEFLELFREEREASRAKKEVEQAQKEAAERLKMFLRDVGARRVELAEEGVKVSVSWTKGRKTLDQNAMKEDGIDLEKYMVEGKGHERINFSEKGPAKADAE